MTMRWVQNTGTAPKQIGDRWVLPGSGVMVDEPDPGTALPRDATVVSVPGGQRQIIVDGEAYGLLPAAAAAAVQASVSEAGIGPLTISAPAGYVLGATLTATTTQGWVVGGYQWTRNGSDISGATSSTYVLTLADVQMPHLPPIVIGCRAVSPVYTYLASVPVGTFPDGYLSLDNGVLSLDGGVLSLV